MSKHQIVIERERDDISFYSVTCLQSGSIFFLPEKPYPTWPFATIEEAAVYYMDGKDCIARCPHDGGHELVHQMVIEADASERSIEKLIVCCVDTDNYLYLSDADEWEGMDIQTRAIYFMNGDDHYRRCTHGVKHVLLGGVK